MRPDVLDGHARRLHQLQFHRAEPCGDCRDRVPVVSVHRVQLELRKPDLRGHRDNAVKELVCVRLVAVKPDALRLCHPDGKRQCQARLAVRRVATDDDHVPAAGVDVVVDVVHAEVQVHRLRVWVVPDVELTERVLHADHTKTGALDRQGVRFAHERSQRILVLCLQHPLRDVLQAVDSRLLFENGDVALDVRARRRDLDQLHEESVVLPAEPCVDGHGVARRAACKLCPEGKKDLPVSAGCEVVRRDVLEDRTDRLLVDEHRTEDRLLRFQQLLFVAHRNRTPCVSTSRFGGCGYSSSLSRYTLSH